MTEIIGREEEKEKLEKLLNSKDAEFLAIYGRRRVGKTYLISQFFKGKGLFLEVTGTKDAPRSEQLRNFVHAVSVGFGLLELPPVPKDWTEAFHLLRQLMEEIDSSEKIILFFDELPWLASRKSGFLSALDHFWNRYASRNKKVILVVCGSAASWMIKKIINNKGGLYGRLTAQIRLHPFTLRETEAFLEAEGVLLDRKQVIEIYLALGGVAKYLMQVGRGMSAAQAIQEVCFKKGAPLTTEFNRLYSSLFDGAENHVHVVTALASKRSGMTQSELLAATKLTSGGGFSTTLQELEESGFILRIPQFGKQKRESKYRLVDEYSLFYLTWIKPALEQNLRSMRRDYWLSMQMSPSYRSWAGYAFEGICLKHVTEIIEALNIDVVALAMGGWTYRGERGAQVDLVIDRADKSVNLCELKYADGEYVLTRHEAENIRYKKECFRRETGTKKSLFATLLTTYGPRKNSHYLSSVDNQLTIDVLF